MKNERDMPWWVWVLLSLLITLVLYGLIGCGSKATAPEDQVEPVKIYITVSNETGADFYGTVSAGLMSKSLAVPAHSEASFWGYRSMLPEKLKFTVTDKPAPKVRK